MQISISFGSDQSPLEEKVTYVREAERLGVHSVWSVEGWGRDAITPLAYLAGQTERILLGTAIMQISARVPAMTAMTALGMAAISNDRFLLGLGVSGPAIVEGLHGSRFSEPLTRLRETVAIIQQALAGEKVAYTGRHHQIPLPGGQGKAIRLGEPPRDVPIYLASLGPRSLRFTGEIAQGWIGTSFIPEYGEGLIDEIRTGASRAGRSLADIDIHVGAATVAFGDDADVLAEPLRMGRAFTLGGMGTAETNFYNDAYARAGYADTAAEVQSLWLAGRRDEAAAAVPLTMIKQNNLLGDDNQIRERLQAFAAAGVTSLKVLPTGSTLAHRLETLGRLMDIVHDLEEP
ncbi:MAG: LLM class flavin-dependent oxidoreductase [Pseudomonadota bacterium]